MKDLPAIQRIHDLSRRPQLGAALQVMASLLWIAQAAAVAMAVQRMADGRGLDDVAPLAVMVFLVGLLRAWLESDGARRLFVQSREVLSALRTQAAQALASRSPLDRARAPSGQAASTLGEQAELVMPFLLRYQSARWRVMLVPPIMVLAVFAFSWVAALVLLIAAPLIPLFMAFVGWRAQSASEAQLTEQGSMNAFLLDRLRGLATLRGLGAVQASALRLRASAQGLRKRTLAVLRIAFLSSAVLELFSALGVAMVAVYVGFHLLGQLEFGAWGDRLSLGQGLFVLMLAPAFFEPLRDLSAAWHDRAAGEAALHAVRELVRPGLSLPGAGAAESEAEALAEREVEREFEREAGQAPGVSMRVPHLPAGDGPRLHVDGPFVLDVAPGEHVALFGPSGCGKSTVLALLSGQLLLGGGHIQIGPTPLREDTAPAIRRRIGWMGQRPHVFAGSVQANLCPGAPAPDEQLTAEALRFAALGQVAQAHPASMLGEGGTGLSGGELARLALARLAMRARTADLLLVDEPTAHLDGDTAARVRDGLLALASGRTLIVATHDPLLAGRMDRVVHLQPAAQEVAEAVA